MTEKTTAIEKKDKMRVQYPALGSDELVELTVGMVRNYVANPTRSGKHPTDKDIVQFMMLCKFRQLNPWEGDAYLVGYDSKDGPTFSLITGINTLLKRAEQNPKFDGLESGVIVRTGDGQEKSIKGSYIPDGAKLVGAWAMAHRKDRSVPTTKKVSLATYDSGRSRWAKDPAGMIEKVARAQALREAFPSANGGGMYISEEMNESNAAHIGPERAIPVKVEDIDGMGEEPSPEPATATVPAEPEGPSLDEGEAVTDVPPEPAPEPEETTDTDVPPEPAGDDDDLPFTEADTTAPLGLDDVDDVPPAGSKKGLKRRAH